MDLFSGSGFLSNLFGSGQFSIVQILLSPFYLLLMIFGPLFGFYY